MDPVDQDERLDRALKGLPAPRAPRSLLPRVLAATVDRPAPAATGWSTWPLGLRVAASVVFLALVAVASMFFAVSMNVSPLAVLDPLGDNGRADAVDVHLLPRS